MAWLDALSAALTAGTTGAAGWLEGQRKGQLEADARAKELFEQLRQKRRDEQERLYQQAQMDRWQRDDERQQAQDVRQGQRDVMEAQDAGYRLVEPFQPTGFASDEPFKALADAQANNAVTLGGRRFVAPLENTIARKARERRENIQLETEKEQRENAQRLREIDRQNAYKTQKTVWAIDPVTNKPRLFTEQTVMELGLERAPSVGGGAGTGAGAGGVRTTDAQKRTEALYSMAVNAVTELNDIPPQPMTLAQSLPGGAKPEGDLGMYTQSWGRQQAAKVADIASAGPYVSSDKAQMQRVSMLKLSEAWLRYTSGAAVPEQEVERFAQTFIPRAGESDAVKARKRASRLQIIESMQKGVGYTPPGQINKSPYLLPGQPRWTPSNEPDTAESGGVSPSLPPDGYQRPNIY